MNILPVFWLGNAYFMLLETNSLIIKPSGTEVSTFKKTSSTLIDEEIFFTPYVWNKLEASFLM